MSDKVIKLNDNLKVKERQNKGRAIISVINGNKEILLSSIKTNDYILSKWISDNNYIIAYTKGTMTYQTPIQIEAAYSIKDQKLVNLSNKKVKELLMNMFLTGREFDLTYILSEINNDDLGLIREDEKYKLRDYLTSSNNNISHNEVVNYILECYPEFHKYMDLKGILSLVKYKEIMKELGRTKFWFYAMPQDLSFMNEESSFLEPYESHKALTLKKNK